MTPDQLKQFDEMQTKLNALLAVTDINFIENIKRRTGSSVKTEAGQSVTSISKAVSEAGSGSYNVAKVFDSKVPIYLSDGSLKYIGVYNS